MKTIRKAVICILFTTMLFSVNIISCADAQPDQELEVTEIGNIDTVGWAGNVHVQGNVAFVSDLLGLNIFDVSDPENPTELSYYDDGVVEPHDMYVDGNLVYLADYTAGLKIVNVTDPENPTQEGIFHDGGEVGPIVIIEDIAFIADFVEGLEIVNISDPSQPIEIVQYDTDITNAYNVEINGDLAYVSDFVSTTDKTLKILNISNLYDIEEIAEYRISGEIFSIDFVGDIAYMSCSFGGVKTFNISNPLDLVELDGFDEGGHAVELDFYQDYIAVADRDNGLIILSISDPTNLTKIDQHFYGGDAAGVMIVNDLIFVANGDDGLEILQIEVITPEPSTTDGFGTLIQTGIIIGGVLGAIVIILIFFKRKKNP